jgi:bleomycin hydrolase
MKLLSFILAITVGFCATAQDNLIQALDKNKSDSAKKKFVFTTVINIENTDVKSQGKSGTCWSYSANSFLESEYIKKAGKKIDLADIYPVRCALIDKAETYVRLHGNLGWGEGGAFHDVTNMYGKYGALPQSVYSGIQYDSKINNFGELQAILEGYLKGVVSNKSGKLSPLWKKSFEAIVDAYLGVPPTEFTYEGKKYTPKSFANDYLGIKATDFVELSSFTHAPFYDQSILLVPDNWSFDKVWNVQMTDMTDIIDHALKNGYSIAWATDVSEKGFSWKNGVAFVHEDLPEDARSEEYEKRTKTMFDGPKPEKQITQENRQKAFDNYETTDDHGMHIVGLSKDQNGKEYYIVKNSWGTRNDQNGYIHVTKAYVQYKTTAILLNKAGLPSSMKSKLKL